MANELNAKGPVSQGQPSMRRTTIDKTRMERDTVSGERLESKHFAQHSWQRYPESSLVA